MADKKVNLLTESFSVESLDTEQSGVKISGFALPFDTTSRNGFSYRKESVTKNYKTLEGKPMFFNHDIESLPIGKVESVSIDDKGMHYKARLYPTTETEKAIVEKVKSGLINNVSIQCMYENANVDESTGNFSVEVKEFLELSLVGVPGFADTTVQAVEKLRKEEQIKMAHKKLKEELKKPVDIPDEETTGEETPITRAEFDDLLNRISIVETRLDSFDEEEDEPEEEGQDKTDNSNAVITDEKSDENYKRKTSAKTEPTKALSSEEIRFKRMMNY